MDAKRPREERGRLNVGRTWNPVRGDFDEPYCESVPNLYAVTHAYNTLVLMAKMGKGKTHRIKKMVEETIARYGRDKTRILFVLAIRTLAYALGNELKQYGAVVYLDTDEKNWPECPFLIISPESLRKLDIGRTLPYHLVVLDESESLLAHFRSTTHKTAPNRKQSFDYLEHFLRTAERRVISDAFIGPLTEAFLRDLCRDDGKTYFYRNISEPRNKFKYILHTGPGAREHFEQLVLEEVRARHQELLDEVQGDGLVYVASLSKKRVRSLARWIGGILRNAEWDRVYDCDTEEQVKLREIGNCNVEWPPVRCLFASPTLAAGVDYQGLARAVFAILTDDSAAARTAMQQIGRVRNPKSREIHVLVIRKPESPQLPESVEEIQRQIGHRMQKMGIECKVVKSRRTESGYEYAPEPNPYNNNLALAQAEENRTRNNVMQEMCCLIEAAGGEWEEVEHPEIEDAQGIVNREKRDLLAEVLAFCEMPLVPDPVNLHSDLRGLHLPPNKLFHLQCQLCLGPQLSLLLPSPRFGMMMCKDAGLQKINMVKAVKAQLKCEFDPVEATVSEKVLWLNKICRVVTGRTVVDFLESSEICRDELLQPDPQEAAKKIVSYWDCFRGAFKGVKFTNKKEDFEKTDATETELQGCAKNLLNNLFVHTMGVRLQRAGKETRNSHRIPKYQVNLGYYVGLADRRLSDEQKQKLQHPPIHACRIALSDPATLKSLKFDELPCWTKTKPKKSEN